MNKKGFTLIEIIAIIVLLSVIALITYPIINNLIGESRDELHDKQISELVRLSNTWVTKNINKLKMKDGYKYNLSFDELNKSGLIASASVKDPKTGNDLPGCMTITYNKDTNGYDVAYDSTCTTSGEVRELTLREKILTEEIKGENQTWTTAWQESDASGLYAQTVGSNKTYYFRGNPTNNYIKFAGKDYRILRVNEDGTIRIMLTSSIGDNVFNSESYTYDKMYYTNSELKTVVDNWFTTNIIGDNASKVVSGNYFCEQAKVVWGTGWTAGSATVTAKESYTPTFECTTDGNGNGVVTSKVGLVTYDEIIYAGGWYYVSGLSNPYYLNSGSYYWTMSPVGFRNDDSVYAYAIAWSVVHKGYADPSVVANTNGVRPVLNLNANTTVTGSGTETDPYIVK